MGLTNLVFVTNTNDEEHTDAFDGDEYRFPPKEPVTVPIDAAQHMLGYGLVDKTDTLLRLGWATKFDPATRQLVENPEGVRRLANFVFEEAEVRPRSSLLEGLMDA